MFIGNINGVKERDCGRHHNQKMSLWEYGKNINYLTYKFKLSGTKVLIGSSEELLLIVLFPLEKRRSKVEIGNVRTNYVALGEIETLSDSA